MGKANQGIFGGWTKKVGNVVGRIVQGQNVYSIYQPNVSNPRTLEQQQNRSKFQIVSSVISMCLAAVRIGFAKLDGYTRGSAYSAAVGFNLKQGVTTGTYPNFEIAWSRLQLSEGSILLPYDPSASSADGEVTYTWADNSGEGDALATDKAVVVLVNITKGLMTLNTSTGVRSDRSAKCSIPQGWDGDTGAAYLFFVRPSSGVCSKTTYYGVPAF